MYDFYEFFDTYQMPREYVYPLKNKTRRLILQWFGVAVF